MNIAIVIGISNYIDAKNNLPGCKNDAEVINEVLKRTEKFQQILYLNENETSTQIKEQIANFIIENKGKAINEFFFYYTGHGEFTNDEFYYVLSDFDSKRRNQTTLQNKEIDDLIRSLGPTLVIKVVDACQSGTSYIKDSNIITKYFQDSQKSFNKCYFLSSSLSSQSSYQTDRISDFTASFVNAIKIHTTNEIRYKGIIDVISDDFDEIPEQTPFFVIQADLTEKFCTITPFLKQYLEQIKFGTQENSDEEQKNILSVYEKIKADAKNYTDKEGAISSLEFIKSEFENFSLREELSELFDVKITIMDDYKYIPKKTAIATWLEKNNHEYFTTTVYNETANIYGETEKTLSGFDLHIESPFKSIYIAINSKFPNLPSYNSQVMFLVSKRRIQFFFFITNLIEYNWDERKINIKDLKWIGSECNITNREDIQRSIKTIKREIEERIDKDISQRFDSPPEDDLPF